MTIRTLFSILSAVVALAISGCGGGGGGSSSNSSATLSGTAASGAALSGVVRITDATGTTRQANTGANGAYSIDVSGMTAPFVLMVEATVGGQTLRYYAPAVAEDINKTINITPLSDLVLADTARDLAANCAASTACIATLTKTGIDVQIHNLSTRLAPTLQALGLDAATDPLHVAFTGGSGTGVDALLDVLSVVYGCVTGSTACINRKMVTITNVVSGASVLDDLGNDGDNNTVPNSTETKDIYDIHLAIRARLAEMDAIAASNDTTATKATKLQAFCTADFLWHGTTCSDFAQWAATWRNWVARLDQIARFDATGVDSVDPSGALDDQHVGVVSKDYARTAMLWRKSATDGKYYVAGDQAVGRYLVSADHYWDASSATGSSYLEAQMVPKWDGTAIADTVTLSGPGLGGGVSYSLTGSGLNGNAAQIPVDDTLSAAIQAGLGGQPYYTFTAINSGVVIGTFKRSLQTAPLPASSLTASVFASVSNPPSLALCNTGGTWVPSYVKNGLTIISTQVQCRDGYIDSDTTTVDNMDASVLSITKTGYTSRFLTTRIVALNNATGWRFTWSNEVSQ